MSAHSKQLSIFIQGSIQTDIKQQFWSKKKIDRNEKLRIGGVPNTGRIYLYNQKMRSWGNFSTRPPRQWRRRSERKTPTSISSSSRVSLHHHPPFSTPSIREDLQEFPVKTQVKKSENGEKVRYSLKITFEDFGLLLRRKAGRECRLELEIEIENRERKKTGSGLWNTEFGSQSEPDLVGFP